MQPRGRGVFQPATGSADTKAGVLNFTQHAAGSPEFEFFDDYDAFLYNVMAGRTTSGTDYFGGQSASDVSKAALDVAVAQLSQAQGNTPAAWRADMPQIVFVTLDVSSIPNIPWENRGTWGQAVDFGPGRSTSGSTPGVPSALPNTGSGAPAALLLVLGAICLASAGARRLRARGPAGPD